MQVTIKVISDTGIEITPGKRIEFEMENTAQECTRRVKGTITKKTGEYMWIREIASDGKAWFPKNKMQVPYEMILNGTLKEIGKGDNKEDDANG